MLKVHKLFGNISFRSIRNKKTYRMCAMFASIVLIFALDVTTSKDVTNYSFTQTSSVIDVNNDERLLFADTNNDCIVLTAGAATITNQEVDSVDVVMLAASEKTVIEATVEEASVSVTVSSSEIQNNIGLNITAADYDALLRIVQAEAGNQPDIGKIMVANVIINRVNDSRFANSIYEVVYQNSGGVYQFSPTASADFENVKASESTIACVERALAGEDYSQGALYFTSYYEDTSWFNTSLTFIAQEGAHYFYK